MTWAKSGTVNRFRVTFTGSDEPLEVQNNLGDVIAWERAHKKGWQQNLDNEAFLWVAWKAARRLGLTSEPTFDQFLARVEDYEIAVDEDADDPTRPDPSAS